MRILAGELVVALITSGVYMLVEIIARNDAFTYRVITGLLLGTAVVVANYAFLTVTVNRAINKVMDMRPDGEMSEDEVMEFAEKHQNTIKNAAALSYIVRTLSMLAAFIIVFVFLSEYFAVVATVVPLLAFRPIIMVSEFFNKRRIIK